MTTNDSHNDKSITSADPFDLLFGEENTIPPDPAEHPWERYMLRTLALARIAAAKGDGRSGMPEGLRDWYAQNAANLDLPDIMTIRQKAAGDDTPAVPVRIPRQAILDQRTPAPPPSPLQRRLDWVSATLGLDERDALVLGIVVRLSISPAVRALVGLTERRTFLDDESDKKFVSRLLGLNEREARDRLGNHAPLRRLGLIEDDHRELAPSAILVALLETDTVDAAELERKLLVQARRPHLLRADFDHLGAAVDDVVRILDGALARREAGINILLYGAPGTGKTELAGLLGTLCTAHVVFAGETGDGASEPTRQDRLTHLSFLSALGQRIGRTIAVVDEAEDLFAGVDTEHGIGRHGSKVFLNRLVEASPIPTIWITNRPALLGEAVLRRMARAVELRTPGLPVRRRIVDRHATELGVQLDSASRERLAQLPVAPAIVAAALRAAHLGGESTDAGIGAMAVASAISIHEAMTGRSIPVPPAQTTPFDPSLSFADIDLEELEAKVVAAGPTAALSFLFTGPPGTGKSAFARHLASRLGMDVLHKRASDLLGPYVGQTEANIAAAFREAGTSRQFLIIDEADSLLSDRRGAVRTWEISQVNEVLTWMESHQLPFAMTTNFAERLDFAVMRRVLFKVQFFPLTPQQIGTAFRRFFGGEAPAGVLTLDPVTPGDFVVVARKAKVLQVTNPATLGEMLRAEVELKPSSKSEPTGFE